MERLEIAKLCHQVNKEYCSALGDHSQTNWEDAPDWQKESALKGVNFHLDNDNTTPEDSHNSWLVEKKAAGWKYGVVKNEEKKEHPCFVPYVRLPDKQKAKDFIFKAICDFFKG